MTSTSNGLAYDSNLGNYYTHSENLYWQYELVSYQDPEGAGDWTTTLLDTAQIGIEDDALQSGSYPGRTTTLWLLVEYSSLPDRETSVAEGVETQGVRIYTP